MVGMLYVKEMVRLMFTLCKPGSRPSGLVAAAGDVAAVPSEGVGEERHE